jgi:dihydroorotase
VSALLLRGGRVIDPTGGIDGARDLLVMDGKVREVGVAGTLRAPADAQVIETGGCWVMPGLIDPHVHLRDPGFPEKETIASGLRAAAAGGFTAVAAMANTSPANDNPEITRYMLKRADDAHAARLVPVSAVTRGLAGRETVDFAAMAEAGARLFSDDGMPVDDRGVLSHAFESVARLGFAISLHEEDRALSDGGAVSAGPVADRLGVAGVPVSAEAQRIRRDLALAIGANAAVHIAHVSTAESLDLIRAARCNSARVTCEVAPHHFALDEGAALFWGPNAKMNPPLRSRADVVAIRCGISDGTIDMIASDHAPHDPDSKRLSRLAPCFGPAHEAGRLTPELAKEFTQAANGIVGLETSLGLALNLVRDSLINASRLVELMSSNPAALLRIDGGSLRAGARADITVVDPNLAWTVDPAKFLSKSRNTPFGGMRLTGKAILTVVAGAIVYDGRRTLT